MIKLSLIIPVYNVEKYLERCIIPPESWTTSIVKKMY